MATANKRAQDFVPIREVRDGVVILKDGSMRSILMTSSVNFALKSEDEQKSIIYQFQNFLNSINFDIQIFLESRRLDIRPYVSLLEEREKEQTNDLMKIQTKEYIQFIKTFTEQANIMTKRFFVVIPYTPPTVDFDNKKKGILGKFTSSSGKTPDKAGKTSNFAEYKQQLDQRVDVVVQGITRTGIRAIQLGTEEVIEVFYQLFNPGEVEKPLAQNS